MISAPCPEPSGFFLQQPSKTKPVKIYPVLAVGLALLQLPAQLYRMEPELVLGGTALNRRCDHLSLVEHLAEE